MKRMRRRLLPLWALAVAYVVMLGVRWTALPHNLVIHFTVMDAPGRFLGRAGVALITILLALTAAALAAQTAPRPLEFERGKIMLGFGFCYGMMGFIIGVFWSLVRINAGIGSPIRPAVAMALAYTALGLVVGVSAPAPLRARRHSAPEV